MHTINTGNAADDGSGDTIRTAFWKVNENFTELSNQGGGGGLDSLTYVWNGQGFPISSGVSGFRYCAFSGNVSGACLVSDVTGIAAVAVSKFTPVSGLLYSSTLLGTLSLSGNQFNYNNTLSGWNTGINAGDIVVAATSGSGASITLLTLNLVLV